MHTKSLVSMTTQAYRFDSRLSVFLGWLPDATGDRECRRFRCLALVLCLLVLEAERLRDRPISGLQHL